MSEAETSLRWGVERRLEFIEFRLFWEGGINRGDIMEFFGVSVPQASKDLSLYQELAPGNLSYDRSAKRYLASKSFRPRFLEPDPDRYLAQLRSLADDLAPDTQTWLGLVPDMGVLPIPHRQVKADVLRTLLAVMRARQSIEVNYLSLNPERTDAQWRRITPHAIGSDGLRWHVRAFCHIDNRFKDFLLSRCLGQARPGAAGAEPGADEDWQTVVQIRLIPNPRLSTAQRRVILQDFDMTDGGIDLAVRKALIFYFARQLRINQRDPDTDPLATPVVVENKEVFDRAVTESMGKLGI